MLPDRVSNPGALTYESGALPIALRGPVPIGTSRTTLGINAMGSVFLCIVASRRMMLSPL